MQAVQYRQDGIANETLNQINNFLTFHTNGNVRIKLLILG